MDFHMSVNTLCVFGTRPEAIKMAPVIRRLAQDPRFNSQICVTGQHQEMILPILELFHITPDYQLSVMMTNQDLSQLTAKILLGLTDVFKKAQPHCVLVHGDTTSTFVAALTAYYHHIPVVHVEAGLRTGDLYAPWPEEANRKLAGCLTDVHFAPTYLSRQNLLNENVRDDAIFVTGNTVIDSLFETVDYIQRHPKVQKTLGDAFPYLNPLRKMILVTGHRRENFGQGFKEICEALSQMAQRFPEVDILYPVHLNPNVQQPVKQYLQGYDNIFLIEPVDYLSFVYLMQSSYLIITDSGGIQEEAPSLGKPVLVMREKTERPEALEAGTVMLVGTQIEKIVNCVAHLLEDKAHYQKMSEAINPYGDGKAAQRIVDVLAEHFVASSTEDESQAPYLSKQAV